MKRFLIPFLALAVTACGSNDIVVTSEVGEKMIVERDTIYQKDSRKADHQESLQSLIKSAEGLQKYYCDGSNPIRCDEGKKEIEAYKHELSLYEGKPWIQKWRYLPVKRDRNGTETVQKEQFIECYSPALTANDWRLLNQSQLKHDRYQGRTLGDLVARTICKEYAKWEELQ